MRTPRRLGARSFQADRGVAGGHLGYHKRLRAVLPRSHSESASGPSRGTLEAESREVLLLGWHVQHDEVRLAGQGKLPHERPPTLERREPHARERNHRPRKVALGDRAEEPLVVGRDHPRGDPARLVVLPECGFKCHERELRTLRRDGRPREQPVHRGRRSSTRGCRLAA